MRIRFTFAALAFVALAMAQGPVNRPRLIVLTDIGGDPDDQQSMVRLMTYSNEFEIAGLIASASGTPGELKKDTVRPDLIREIVDAYAQVRGNLVRHAEGYPEAKTLLATIKSGNRKRGVENVGKDKSSEGSDWIISVVDRVDARPVNVAIWGGPTDLAQALWRVRNERSPAELKRFVSKLRVYAIGHQDDSGPWIVENFPELFYIVGAADPNDVSGRRQTGPDRRLSAYRGMYLGGDIALTSREWVDTNIRTNHGPLGALYPVKTFTAPNPHAALKEGDTPSWFYFLRNGLNDPEHPEWGGWGGRFRQIRPNLYNDSPDTVEGVNEARATVWRWRPAFQNDFQARMDWCVTPHVTAVNHAPKAVINGDASKQFVAVAVRAGERVRLSAVGSSDRDGNRLTYRWFHYREAGTFSGFLELAGNGTQTLEFVAPDVSEARSIHIILAATDDGTPSLTAYRRAIITVQPARTKKS